MSRAHIIDLIEEREARSARAKRTSHQLGVGGLPAELTPDDIAFFQWAFAHDEPFLQLVLRDRYDDGPPSAA